MPALRNVSEFCLKTQLEQAGIPFVREHKFHPDRKWRFDFAFPAHSLAVEIEGALWTSGAHSRPLGIIRDMKKGNAAVLLGWRVLRYTTTQANNGEALEGIRKFLSKERL